MVNDKNPNEDWIRKEYIMDSDIRTIPEDLYLYEMSNYVEIIEQVVAEQRER